jgi:hypothetical protein
MPQVPYFLLQQLTLLFEVKAEADRKADQEKAEADRKAMQEQADANTKAVQELQNMMKANREDLKSGQSDMIAAIKGKMDAMIANIKNARKETTACQEVTRANPENIEPNLGGDRSELERDSKRSCRSSSPEDIPKRDNNLPRYDEDEAQSRKDAVRGGASRDPEGRRRSDANRRTEEAT